jgi:hypothetical protein
MLLTLGSEGYTVPDESFRMLHTALVALDRNTVLHDDVIIFPMGEDHITFPKVLKEITDDPSSLLYKNTHMISSPSPALEIAKKIAYPDLTIELENEQGCLTDTVLTFSRDDAIRAVNNVLKSQYCPLSLPSATLPSLSSAPVSSVPISSSSSVPSLEVRPVVVKKYSAPTRAFFIERLHEALKFNDIKNSYRDKNPHLHIEYGNDQGFPWIHTYYDAGAPLQNAKGKILPEKFLIYTSDDLRSHWHVEEYPFPFL